MAIRLIIEGIKCEVGTAPEALELIRLSRNSPSTNKDNESDSEDGVANKSSNGCADIQVFIEELNDNGRQIMRVLVSEEYSHKPIYTRELAVRAGLLFERRLPPTIKHIRFAARKANLPDNFLVRMPLYSDTNGRESGYKIGREWCALIRGLLASQDAGTV